MGLFDTIAAISTPRGVGGVAVIRISGDSAVDTAECVFRPASGRRLTEYPARTAVYGVISTPCGEEIDRGIATVYRAPASYTGEDTVELSCHGGAYVTREVLGAVLSAGAVMAEPGEFTRRALISGKLTLTEAEAVGELIDADTAERRRLASSAVRGVLSQRLGDLAERLSGVMSALYAAIDYPDEDIGDEGERSLAGVIDEVLSDVNGLLSTYRQGRAVTEGVRCVICGLPNAGKSSLYNMIVGDSRAIVTDIAGTTRDVLSERVSFGGVTLILSDTAGLRDTEDTVEQIGVERARSEMEAAELILYVIDNSSEMTGAEREEIAALPDVPRIGILNKCDLPCAVRETDLKELRESFDDLVEVSCVNGDGADELSASVGRIFDSGVCDLGRDPVIWSVRHEAALRRAADYLSEASIALSAGAPTDAVCTLCESALAELRETDGRGVTEDIVDGIFRHFCVGK